MAKRGRPPAITPEAQTKFFNAIKGGNYREIAAEWAGIPRSTLNLWIANGKKRTPEPIYKQFLDTLLEAERSAEILCVGRVMTATAEDVRAAQWFLERKFPERWGSDRRELRELRKALSDLLKAVDVTKLQSSAKGKGSGSKPQPRIGGEATPESV